MKFSHITFQRWIVAFLISESSDYGISLLQKPRKKFSISKFSFLFEIFSDKRLIFSRLQWAMHGTDFIVDPFCNWFQHVLHTAPYCHVLLLRQLIGHVNSVSYTKWNVKLTLRSEHVTCHKVIWQLSSWSILWVCCFDITNYVTMK